MQPILRIWVVEDDPYARDMICEDLGSLDGIQVVGSSALLPVGKEVRGAIDMMFVDIDRLKQHGDWVNQVVACLHQFSNKPRAFAAACQPDSAWVSRLDRAYFCAYASKQEISRILPGALVLANRQDRLWTAGLQHAAGLARSHD